MSRVLDGDDEPSPAWPIDWTEDGIVYQISDSIMLLDSVGGTSVKIADADFGGMLSSHMTLIPGGRYLVHHTGAPSEESEIRVYDTQTGTGRSLVPHGLVPRFVPPDHLFFLTSDRTLHAAPFDPSTATLTGTPFPVVDSVFFREGNVIQGSYDVSSSGDGVFLVGGVDVISVDRRIVRVGPDGTETPLSVPPGPIWSPRLGPDGRTLVYVRDSRIHLFDLILSRDEPIPGESEAGTPVWGPEGERLAYRVFTGDGSELRIYRVGDDEPTGIPTSVSYDWMTPVAWTPDGRSLVLNVEEQDDSGDYDWDVVVARLGADTAVVEPYLPGAWQDIAGSLAPDGDWLVYASNEGGVERLWARSFPEPGPAIE
ncbi:MAG: hypothetical protein R3324_18255, partial [Halobacteriales archaeon]|nr:hypothetical protein [Halobacteriales archaeon]